MAKRCNWCGTEEIYVDYHDKDTGVPVQVNHVGSMFTVFFSGGPVWDYATAKEADPGAYALFFHRLLRRGIYFPPSQFEAAFVSTAHSSDDIKKLGQAIHWALKGLPRGKPVPSGAAP
ncbi:MAG: hypothetical protein IH964_08625 [Candidatus Dadabacteria bacterium]|nr:hypothetical protein [Candidatus Dadabacteria bacterium]